MVHPLVEQLRFARSEFVRGLEGVTEPAAQRRFLPMNCISWNIGHLAWQEQRYWLDRAQAKMLLPDVNEQFANGAPATTPALADMRRAWREITTAADPWLDSVSRETLVANVIVEGHPDRVFGSLLQRMIYHYWYHTGENAAIRQQLGHTNLPDFVGDIDHEAPYRPEPRT
jgi:uncharacterized damage-inducible protein DinB